MRLIREACVETIEQALQAEKNGADRIEYCAQLELDGLTPSPKEIETLIFRLQIPIKVMIRIRAGNFIYSTREIETMKHQIKAFESIGIDQFVLGALTTDKQIDIKAIESMCSNSTSTFTFHKALDLTKNPLSELEKLRPVKQICSILSSGSKTTAEAGIENINQLIEQFGQRFKIIAAGKITKENLALLSQKIKTNEFHGRAIV